MLAARKCFEAKRFCHLKCSPAQIVSVRTMVWQLNRRSQRLGTTHFRLPGEPDYSPPAMLGAARPVLTTRERGPSSSLYGGDMAWIQVCPIGCECGRDGDAQRCGRNRGRVTVMVASVFGSLGPGRFRIDSDRLLVRAAVSRGAAASPLNKQSARLVLYVRGMTSICEMAVTYSCGCRSRAPVCRCLLEPTPPPPLEVRF
jgi:hypothetical protein